MQAGATGEHSGGVGEGAAREHLDVLIVGAGLSGIGAAYHLKTECPDKTFALLEARLRLGGTWDLFRYPGIRSDSDMYTLGYSWKPWTQPKAIADGPSILAYLREAAEEHGIDRAIRYGHQVIAARWSTPEARWTVRVSVGGEERELTCAFLLVCAGYYDYDEGYTPHFEGRERFQGSIVHPQKWTDDVDYEGKRVVIIGSGATAVTLVPAMADRAAHVTMLQRSPTYIVSLPGRDKVGDWLREHLPRGVAYSATRWKNVLFGMALYNYCQRRPEKAKKALVGLVKKSLGDAADVETNFTPRYDPWDQRLCLVPDGDLFEAIKSGKASVVTDHIETFTEKGILLRSGRELEADLVVTATGLKLKFLGGMALEVDGVPFEQRKALVYKGLMASDVPNLAFVVGYTNASWTLKADLVCEYVCRLLRHMDSHGKKICVPRRDDPTLREEPLMTLSSGYVQRAMADFPRQGDKGPWRVNQSYARDLVVFRHTPIEDGALRLS
jgi:monooxygenase